jgi:hypothetical protein
LQMRKLGAGLNVFLSFLSLLLGNS